MTNSEPMAVGAHRHHQREGGAARLGGANVGATYVAAWHGESNVAGDDDESSVGG